MHRILVVEDYAVVARVISRSFEKAGYQVDVVPAAADALLMLAGNSYSLIITDHQMPGMSGTDLCRELHKAEEWSQIPVIMVTAKVWELDVPYLRDELNVARVYSKPVSPSELVEAAREILGCSNGCGQK